MIYIHKSNVDEKDFVDLLEKSKNLTLDFLKTKTNISSGYFETIVFKQTCRAAKNTPFENSVRQTGAFAFPDIIANEYFGIEVKMTIKDHWFSTGNSVVETSRIEDVKRIYIVFGKFGGEIDIRYRLYQECLSEVSVTHSPRYRINMDLPAGESIFEKMGIEYDFLRKDKRLIIQKIKNYYRRQLKEGEELWWIDKESGGFPVMKLYRNLSKKEKEEFIVEAMILFPEIFSEKIKKFERLAPYLATRFNAVCPNIRDSFTSKGRVKINISGKRVSVPRIFFNLFLRAKIVAEKIESFNEDDLAFYWRVDKIKGDKIEQWKKIINRYSSTEEKRISLADIFEAGHDQN